MILFVCSSTIAMVVSDYGYYQLYPYTPTHLRLNLRPVFFTRDLPDKWTVSGSGYSMTPHPDLWIDFLVCPCTSFLTIVMMWAALLAVFRDGGTELWLVKPLSWWIY